MATRKSVDQILDTAADILEKHGWVTETCYDSHTGGYCALGAIAKAVYPKTSGRDLGDVAYINDDMDPRHREAIETLARLIARRKNVSDLADDYVYSFNDSQRPGAGASEEARFKSSQKVVAKLRKAAENFRKGKVAV